MRASGSDGVTILQGIRDMPLEKCIEWIDEDEWIEITPNNIRLRKKTLAQNMRSVIRSPKRKKNNSTVDRKLCMTLGILATVLAYF